jgi:hypothetical protein
MIERGVLKHVLLAYRAASAHLATETLPPVGAITDDAQIIADYIESFHEGLEGAYVFARVSVSSAATARLVHTLMVQHDRGRHLTAAILTATASGCDLSSPSARAALQTYLDQFVRMCEPHEAWEDTVHLPGAAGHDSPATPSTNSPNASPTSRTLGTAITHSPRSWTASPASNSNSASPSSPRSPRPTRRPDEPTQPASSNSVPRSGDRAISRPVPQLADAALPPVGPRLPIATTRPLMGADHGH